MRFLFSTVILILAGWAVYSPSRAEARDRDFAFVDPAGIDLRFLGNPPGSAEERAEIGTLLFLQNGRTPEAVVRIAAEGKLTLDAFGGSVGPWCVAASLPKTASLLASVRGDVERAAQRGKGLWGRTFPAREDRRIHPAVALPPGSSYPCTVAAVGTVWGFVLGELLPDSRPKLFQRAAEIGDDQALGGLCYPSDVIAGRKLGVEFMRLLLADPGFQAALEEARAEVAAAAKAAPAIKP